MLVLTGLPFSAETLNRGDYCSTPRMMCGIAGVSFEMRLVRTIAFIAVGLAGAPLCAPIAMAQQAPAAPGPAAPASDAPTASGVGNSASTNLIFSPGHLQAAREVIIGSGIVRSFDGFIPQFIDQARATMGSTRPELIKDLDEIAKTLPPKLSDLRAEIIEIGARVYANRLSESELKEVAAFFKTPAGSKYVNSQPQILEELFADMQGWTQRLGVRVVELFREELQKRGRDVN